MAHAGHTYHGINLSGDARGHFGNANYTFNQYFSSSDKRRADNATQLSVPEAIFGLLAISGQLCSNLSSFVSRVQGAPVLARSIHAEISAFRGSLDALSSILRASGPLNPRASFFPADSIVASLTDAVLLFDRIEREMRPFTLCEKFGVTERGRWAWRRPRIVEMVNCIQWHKATMALQLSILRSTTDQSAIDSRERLCNLIEGKLSQERELSVGMLAVEAKLEEMLNKRKEERLEIPESDHENPLLIITKPNPQVENHPDLSGGRNDLDDVLLRTKVYARTQHRSEDNDSLRSGTFRHSRLSILSQTSIGDISILSLVALPIRIRDIQSGSYYDSSRGSASIPSHEEDPPLQNASASDETVTPNVAVDEEPGINWRGPDVLKSALPIDLLPGNTTLGGTKLETVDDYIAKTVLFVCASLFRFSVEGALRRREAGYPYLEYVEGEVFNVHAQKGELWLATRQDEHPELGWIWEQHFVILSQEL